MVVNHEYNEKAAAGCKFDEVEYQVLVKVVTKEHQCNAADAAD